MDAASARRAEFARSLVNAFSGRPSPDTNPEAGDIGPLPEREVSGASEWTETAGAALLAVRLRKAESDGQDVIPTCCFSCNTACEVLAFRDRATGRVVKIEGDPSSPVTRGFACAKGLAASDLLYNPERLKVPLRRKGSRSKPPEWEEIGWDEALDTIASKVLEYRDRYGPQGIAFLEGTRRGWSRVFTRLANAFGAPNHGAAGWAQCLWPRLVDCKVTFGAQYPEACDIRRSECVLVWGSNPAATWPLVAADIMDARERGALLIVVDPRLSETAAKADIWLQLRPGSDTDLALGMLRVILEENLHDRAFVEEWTVGFEDLRAHVVPFTPEETEGRTGVPEDRIRRAARAYATTHPASLFRCVSVDQTADSVQTCRALSLLIAVTGNVDVPGGNVLVSNRGEISQNSHDFILAGRVPEEAQRLRRGYDRFPLLCGPVSSVPCAHMPTLWETIDTGEPYPVKAALIFGSNAAVSYTNTPAVERALGKLEFLAVCDLFLTPTAEWADIVLPASSWLERDNVISSFQTSLEHTVLQRKVVPPVGESRSDVDIVCDLARRLGVGDLFWRDSGELYDHLLSPTGLSFRAALDRRRLSAPLRYGVFRTSGFKTPSGKVELVSSILFSLGSAPLPPGSPSPDRPGEGGPELPNSKYPFFLTTGARSIFFRHTENRRNPWLRAQCPDPVVYLNDRDAEALSVADGDLVEVRTRTGSAFLVARPIRGQAPGVVQAVPGWDGEGNINRTLGWECFAEGIGTVPMRGLVCDIRKVGHGG